jgi:hypothetical protein
MTDNTGTRTVIAQLEAGESIPVKSKRDFVALVRGGK